VCNHYRDDPAWREATGDWSEIKIQPFDNSAPRPNTQSHLYPGRTGEIVIVEGDATVAAAANWRLVPPWFKGSLKEHGRRFGGCNNARVEGIASNGVFKSSLKNRCLIPVGSIFEYAKEPGPDGKKIEYEFTPTMPGPLWVAGIFSRVNIDGGPLTTYAMVMTKAGPDALSIGHERSPIFLPRDRMADWLNPANDPEDFAVSPQTGTFALRVAAKSP